MAIAAAVPTATADSDSRQRQDAGSLPLPTESREYVISFRTRYPRSLRHNVMNMSEIAAVGAETRAWTATGYCVDPDPHAEITTKWC
jgi:hypothetical protein